MSDNMEDHYVPMEVIKRSKTIARSKREQPSTVDSVYGDPYSIVSSDEDDTVKETPSCSGTPRHSASSSGASGGDGQPYELHMPESRKVVLHPGPEGLGISIAGGVNSSLGFLPVFITDIDPGGLVDDSKALKVGDRILSVNGEDMGGKTHRDVVLAIKAANENLVLEVTQGPENILKYVSLE